MFWNNFYKLCTDAGKTPNKVAAELGLSTAIATKWKNGTVPKWSTIVKIAEYFDVEPSLLVSSKIENVRSLDYEYIKKENDDFIRTQNKIITKIEKAARDINMPLEYLCGRLEVPCNFFENAKTGENSLFEDAFMLDGIAEILGTTKEYLTDVYDQKEKPTQADRADYMTQLFRKLSDKNKDILIEIMEKMLEGENNND